MNFAESESYLYSLGNEVLAMKLGLDKIRKLLAELKDPHKNYPKVQVAGTNGKGSVCAFLEAICLAADIRIGVTISPHLVSITERVKINGKSISESEFARLATIVRTTAESLVNSGELESVPTYFEQVTAIALLAFSKSKVELAILETGLGGRLDATTAAEAEFAAITQIDYDHQAILGETITRIAAEKAAIIGNCTKSVVVATQLSEVMGVILQRCEEVGIKPRLASGVLSELENGGLILRTDKAVYRVKKLGLLGEHQIENAKVAILVSESLQEMFPITSDSIVSGLENGRHPGRVEISGRFIFDGAHNLSGARAFRRFLDENVTEPITMIFATMSDKDIAEIASVLFPKAKTLILTRPDNPRSALPADIKNLVPENVKNVVLTTSVSDALSEAQKYEGRIVITGSLYLIGEAKKILNN